MTGPAMYRVITALEQRGHRLRHHGNRATTWCTHDGADNPNALSIFDNGSRVLMHCFTRECTQDEIAESLGLTWRDLYHDPQGDTLATYRYDDGRTVYRKTGKKFHQTGTDKTPTLYRLSRVTEAVAAGQPVYLVEGEEDVHSLESVGLTATTAPMGARNVDKVDASPLQGAHVIAIRDRDDEGSRWAELVTAKLDGIAATLRIAHSDRGKDASDHIALGGTGDELIYEDADSAQRAATIARYPALDLHAVMDPDRPAREYVIDGLIPAGVSISLAAPAGTGKSLLTLAIALAVSRGQRTFAQLTIPTKRRVLYVDMENTADDLAERFESFGVGRTDALDGLVYLSLPSLPPLDTKQGGADLMAILDAYQLGANDLVILDSLQRVTSGPENDSDTMRAYYLHTGIRLKRAGVTSIRLDNTGKDTDRGSRGTSGKRDDVDLELVMLPDADDDEKFHIRVNKTRLSDQPPLTLTRFINREGRTKFSTKDDSLRNAIRSARTLLDQAGVDPTASIATIRDVLAGRNFTDRAIRIAARERGATAAAPLPACAACGYPMTSLGDGATTHPGCEEN